MYSTLPRPPAPCPQAPALASPVSTLSRPIPRTFVLLTKCCRFIVIHQPVKFDSKSLNTQRNSKQYITHEPKHLSHNHIIKSFVTIRYVMYIYTTYTRSPSPRFYLLPLLPKKHYFVATRHVRVAVDTCIPTDSQSGFFIIDPRAARRPVQLFIRYFICC